MNKCKQNLIIVSSLVTVILSLRNLPKMTNITIEADKVMSAAEILSTRSGYEDTPIKVIAKILCQHLEELIEEMLHNPEWFFKTDHRIWRDIDKQFALEAEKTEAA